MISMYAEYSGRTLYVALSTDTIEGAKNGDKLYHMDTGKRYVYNDTNNSWDEQPEEGGGGGGAIKLEIKEVRITNLRTSSVSFNYLEELVGVPGVFPVGSKNILANDTATITKMGIQDGYFNIRFTVGNIKFTYNGVDLPVIQGGKNNYYYAIPYVGNDYAYEMSYI